MRPHLVSVLLFISTGKLATAAPALTHNHHPLLNSPLFNTPLPPPPFPLGRVFPRLFRPPQALKLDVANLDTRSHHHQPLENPKQHGLLGAITVTDNAPLALTPVSTLPLPDAETTPSTTAAPNPATDSSTASSNNTSDPTPGSVIIIPANTISMLPPGPSPMPTTTTTTLPASTPTTNNTDTDTDTTTALPAVIAQSVTFLETVAFTTTVLPAVTVTGLLTLTSVVVVSGTPVGGAVAFTTVVGVATGGGGGAVATAAAAMVVVN